MGRRQKEFTYVEARGCLFIDYVFVNEVGNNINSFKVDKRVESDHMLLITKLRIEGKSKKEGTEKEEIITKIRWGDETKQILRIEQKKSWRKKNRRKVQQRKIGKK